MTFSYSSPLAGSHHVVRFLIGDTDATRPLISDEEILWALTQRSNVTLAAADVADTISLALARRPDIRTQDTSVTWSMVAKQYAALATQLRRQAWQGGAGIYAGGLSLSEKATARSETDLVQPSFTRTSPDEEALRQSDWSEAL